MIDNWTKPKWNETNIPFHVPYHLSLYATAFLAFDWHYESRNDLLHGVWKDSQEHMFDSLVKDQLSEHDWELIISLIQYLAPSNTDIVDAVNLFRVRVERFIYFGR